MKCSLLLNANYEPLCFIDQVRAIRLLYKDKIEIIDYGQGPSLWDDLIRTPRKNFKIPATVKLKKKIKLPQITPRFQKRALFNRDGWRCQYCLKVVSGKQVTIDHIIPKSRGGSTSWHNCVTACQDCNTHKRDMTPEQAGLKLRKVPTIPTRMNFMSIAIRQTTWHPDWSVFLGDQHNI
jgi:5-methylcytosine-specific restriction endonuclease McrA